MQMSIKPYFDANVNIKRFCCIPVKLNIICRVVKETIRRKHNSELQETFTELFVVTVENTLIYQHPDFKEKHVDETVNAIPPLKEDICNHARIARHGMGYIPIKITFTKKDVVFSNLAM